MLSTSKLGSTKASLHQPIQWGQPFPVLMESATVKIGTIIERFKSTTTSRITCFTKLAAKGMAAEKTIGRVVVSAFAASADEDPAQGKFHRRAASPRTREPDSKHFLRRGCRPSDDGALPYRLTQNCEETGIYLHSWSRWCGKLSSPAPSGLVSYRMVAAPLRCRDPTARNSVVR